MSRSLKKGAYSDPRLTEKIAKFKASGTRELLKTWARDSVITPEMVGLTIGVYTGKKHEPVVIVESMVGQKLGEFAMTRTWRGHAKKGKLSKVYGGTGRHE
jgi:small subunit ribosomal protein S19